MLKFITAKFKSKCHETAREIATGQNCLFDTQIKKVFHLESETAKKEAERLREKGFADWIEKGLEDNYYRK